MDPMTSMYVAQGIHGLAYGMILFLISSGLTFVFGMMGILNFAHAAFFMLAAYFGYSVIRWTGNFWMALLIAPVWAALFGSILEKFLIHRVRVYGHWGEVFLTAGIAMVIDTAVKKFWGREGLAVAVPAPLDGMANLFGLEYPVYRLFVIGLGCLVLTLMGVVLYGTRLGKIIRAAVSDAGMVNALGINMPMIFTLVFGIGTWLAGLAGVVVAPILTVFPGLASQVGMDAFMVVIAGGLGSLKGALIISLIFGFLSSYGVQFLSEMAPLLTLGSIAVLLAIRPLGLFGERK